MVCVADVTSKAPLNPEFITRGPGLAWKDIGPTTQLTRVGKEGIQMSLDVHGLLKALYSNIEFFGVIMM